MEESEWGRKGKAERERERGREKIVWFCFLFLTGGKLWATRKYRVDLINKKRNKLGVLFEAGREPTVELGQERVPGGEKLVGDESPPEVPGPTLRFYLFSFY